jgi:hypothetical protein
MGKPYSMDLRERVVAAIEGEDLARPIAPSLGGGWKSADFGRIFRVWRLR